MDTDVLNVISRPNSNGCEIPPFCREKFQEKTIMKRWIKTVVLAVDFALDWIAYVIERQADKILIRRLRSEARAEQDKRRSRLFRP
jgi:hypothetical protein